MRLKSLRKVEAFTRNDIRKIETLELKRKKVVHLVPRAVESSKRRICCSSFGLGFNDGVRESHKPSSSSFIF